MMAVKISSWLIRSGGFGFCVFVFFCFFFLTFKNFLASTLNTTLLVSFQTKHTSYQPRTTP